jgi:hypothetical protein
MWHCNQALYQQSSFTATWAKTFIVANHLAHITIYSKRVASSFAALSKQKTLELAAVDSVNYAHLRQEHSFAQTKRVTFGVEPTENVVKLSNASA